MRKQQIALCLLVFALLSGSALFAQIPPAGIDRFDAIVEMSMNFNPAQPAEGSMAKQYVLIDNIVQKVYVLLWFNISGTLRTCAGAPVAGVVIRGLKAGTQDLLSASSLDATDASGFFSFKAPPGSDGGVFVFDYPTAQPSTAPVFTDLDHSFVINFTTTVCP